MIEKIEKAFFFFLIFFLPFQARIILKSFSQPFNEWNAISFYLTDLLLGAVIFLWLIFLLKQKEENKFRIGKSEIILFLFWLIGALSVFKAENAWVAVFREIKLIEFGLLFLYIKNNLQLYSLKTAFILIASGLIQSFIAIGQFVRQKSFGLNFLDESPLAPDLPGVAKIFSGEPIIRGYGLMPHPNVLAAFLFLALFVLVFILVKKEKLRIWEKIAYPISFFVLLAGLALTFSRTIILIGSVTILAWLLYLFLQNNGGKKVFSVFLLLVICYCLLAILLWPLASGRFAPASFGGQAIDLRLFYNNAAFKFVGEDPFFGVGIGNFVTYFMKKDTLAPWMYQPAHNLYLLVAAETGLSGLAVFLTFLGMIFYRFYQTAFKNPFFSGFLLLAIGYLLFAFSDHYFWTLQQGGLMFWGVLGILAGTATRD